MSDYTENKTPNLIINTVEDPSKLSEITVGENEIVLVPDETEEEIAKKQDKLVAGTNITLVDDPLTQTTLISSTAQESFFRGKFGRWSQVPTDSTQYDPEPGTQDKTTPTINDFMVIADASDYAGVEVDVFTNEGATILNEYWSVTDFLPISPGTYAKVNYTRTYGQSARGQISLYTENKTLLYSREYQTTTGSGDYTDEFQLPNNCYYVKVQYMTNYDTTEVLTLGGAGMFTGSWRFYYSGVWNADGKSGWKPQYQIENVLPIASDTVAGISKLYTSTGQNTDGSMTQKSVTDALNRIQDSCFRGSWDTWNDVPTVDTLYPEDWKYSHTPTYNDYMVVNDATGYVPSDLLTVELIVTQMNNGDCYYTIGSDTYHKTRQSGQNAPFGPNNEMSWNTLGEGPQGTRITFNDQVKYQNRVYNAGESINLPNVEGSYSVADLPKSFFIKRNVETLTGAWRFSYQGVWATDGKSGWREEYQIENTLPEATSTVKGIAKLYTTTGSNTDGSMDQNSITTALGTKQNTLTAGNNITIDANSKIDAADKTLVSFVIWEDEQE